MADLCDSLRTYLDQEAFGSKLQVSCHSTPPGFWCQVFRHAVLLTGRYENTLYSGQRSMACYVQRIC